MSEAVEEREEEKEMEEAIMKRNAGKMFVKMCVEER